MGIADFFRPKYRHSDVNVRLEAVANLTQDDVAILENVARNDREAAVRRIAIEKLDDADLLAEIASAESDRALRDYTRGQAASRWIIAAAGDDPVDAGTALDGLIRLGDARALVEVATRSPLPEQRTRALENVKDNRAIADLARQTQHPALRAAALAKIDDPDVLAGLAIDTTTKELGIAAVERFDEEDLLERVAQKAKVKGVRQRARRRLDDLVEAKKPVTPQTSDAARRRHAEQAQLLREMEHLAETHDWEKAAKEVARIEAEWTRLAGSDDPAVEERFSRALTKYQTRHHVADEQNEHARHALEEKRRLSAQRAAVAPPPVVHAPVVEPKLDLGGGAGGEARGRERDSASLGGPPAPVRRDENDLERSKQIAASLDALLGEMATMLESQDGRAIDRLLGQAAKAFEQVGKATADLRRGLDERYQQARSALVIKVQELREAEDWQRWANVPRAEALVKEAVALLEAEAPTLDQLKALQLRWKELGAIPRKKSQELWDQFKASCDQVFEKVKAGRAVQKEKTDEAIKVKEALIAEAETLADSTDWEATAESFKQLQKRWKESGVVPRKVGDALWKKFRSACDRFFERRKPHLDAAIGEQTDNLTAKATLCEKAEALVAAAPGEAGWGAAINAIRELQREWKEIGFVPRKDADAIYARFRTACDGLFAKRDAARDAEAEAQRAEVDRVRGELARLTSAPAGAVTEALAARNAARELGLGGDAGVAAMLRAVIEANLDAVAGTELDPTAMQHKREKLIARAEELLPRQRPTIDAGGDPAAIAAALKQAMKSNALGDFKGAGRDPYQAIDELRAAWAEIGPVVGASAPLVARFEEVCTQVLAAAGPRKESEERPRRDRNERGDRGEAPRRERRERKPRESAPLHVTTESSPIVDPSAIASLSAAREAMREETTEEVAAVPGIVTAAPDDVTLPTPLPLVVAPPVPTAAAPAPVAAVPAPEPEPAPAPPSASEMAGDGGTEGDIDSGWD